MTRTMSEKDFYVWQELANKYAILFEVLGRGNGWVCIYIGY